MDNVSTSEVTDFGQNIESQSTVENTEAKRSSKTKASSIAPSGVTVGAVLIGSVAAIVLRNSRETRTQDSDETHEPESAAVDLESLVMADNEVPLVASESDAEMSFDEAFTAARGEVGPGGVFLWDGKLYGTFTADEWENMTPEQRSEFSTHFTWEAIDTEQSDVAGYSPVSAAPAETVTAEQVAEDDVVVVEASPVAEAVSDDDIEIVSVNHDSESVSALPDEGTASSMDSEIEVLSVIHDDSSNVNLATVEIDGQSVVLVDVDADNTFDYLGVDENGDGMVSYDEMIALESDEITVEGFGGFTTGLPNDLLADNNLPDYSNE